MVKLEEVTDEKVGVFPNGTEDEEVFPKEPEAAADEGSESEDDEDDFDEEETLYERIIALKQIFPKEQRNLAASAVSTASSLLHKGGNLLWIVSSSVLLLSLPYAVALSSEQQLIEMEKEMSLQQSSNDVLAPGADSAFAPAAA
ncbi:unnamed protein product [Kuraishia capsulata CBS 1993]|uniref:Mitochondrial import receptor subunit TOM22 n=1 Tax=Kuraishia capsulata CBS 1993 TaxID=1382522 RepID=W6MFR2_9ASCO|nr:uncharacterized protein KUCA_T00000429001 [Kuraishia capsulata CBS 1993]CDK24466.1 unnamed protein product [Kuraishia capsulata CBS 1993]